METYLKHQATEGVIFSAVKVTKNGALEVSGAGSMEVTTDSPEVILTNLELRGFMNATKEEFDELATRAAMEINALV